MITVSLRATCFDNCYHRQALKVHIRSRSNFIRTIQKTIFSFTVNASIGNTSAVPHYTLTVITNSVLRYRKLTGMDGLKCHKGDTEFLENLSDRKVHIVYNCHICQCSEQHL